MAENKSSNSKNPLAFPAIDETYLQEGMSLRDYFAAKAMQVYLKMAYDENSYSNKRISEKSYQIADAMLEERTKQNKS